MHLNRNHEVSTKIYNSNLILVNIQVVKLKLQFMKE